MSDTYTKIYIHIVFSVKGRQPLMPKQHKAELHQYITGIINNKRQKVMQINSMPDHIHILVGMTPDLAISDLVRDIKKRYQRKYHTIHQPEPLGTRKIYLARGMCRIQPFVFAGGCCRRLHPKTGKASCKQNV